MKKIQTIKLTILFLASLFLCGCATLSYVGEDYDQDNIQTIKDNVNLSYIRYSYLDHSGIHKDRYHIHINALYDDVDIYERLEQFKNSDENHKLFVIAGHAYEFEVKNDWDKIEKLLAFLANDKTIKVLTLKEAVKEVF